MLALPFMLMALDDEESTITAPPEMLIEALPLKLKAPLIVGLRISKVIGTGVGGVPAVAAARTLTVFHGDSNRRNVVFTGSVT